MTAVSCPSPRRSTVKKNIPSLTLEIVDATPELAQALANLINMSMVWRNADVHEKILAEVDLAVAVDDLVRELRKDLPGVN